MLNNTSKSWRDVNSDMRSTKSSTRSPLISLSSRISESSLTSRTTDVVSLLEISSSSLISTVQPRRESFLAETPSFPSWIEAKFDCILCTDSTGDMSSEPEVFLYTEVAGSMFDSSPASSSVDSVSQVEWLSKLPSGFLVDLSSSTNPWFCEFDWYINRLI